MVCWEYCDVTWQPDQIILTVPDANGPAKVETFDSATWPQLLAQLGAEGWELVTTTASPVGIHEYYFYFKRPLEE
jgi:hypothetical protein